MDAAELAKKMQKEREFWVEIEPGKRLKLLRPLMDESAGFATDFGVKHVAEFLRDWSGIVEGDLISGGSTTPVDFDHEIASILLRDHIAWSAKAAKGMADAMVARAEATAVAVKNLVPS